MESAMPIDLRSLHKLDFSAAPTALGSDRLLVLVRLCDGAQRPGYIAARAEISHDLFSAEISVDELARLEEDPAVQSVELSRKVPPIG
jgi:hypothetical protein